MNYSHTTRFTDGRRRRCSIDLELRFESDSFFGASYGGFSPRASPLPAPFSALFLRICASMQLSDFD